MPRPDPPAPEPTETTGPETPELPETTSPGGAELPRLPYSPRRATTPGPDETTASSGPGPDRSSRASTDPPAPADPTQTTGKARVKGPDDLVDVKDLRSAIAKAADVAFVLVGQGIGNVHARARRQPPEQRDPARWVPSVDERKLVLAPAGRIITRHVTADVATADTVDGCLIAAGVGGFAMRTLFNLSPLDALEETPHANS